MRLIDADKLKQFFMPISRTEYSDLKVLMKINDQPTACDIDAIKSEIQFYADNHAEQFEMGAYYHCLKIIDDYTYE